LNSSTRERIAQAAFELFRKNGYENVTMQDISREAGLSRKTLYTYYRSKEEIVAHCHARLAEDSPRDLMLGMATMNSYHDKLSFLYSSIAETMRRYGPDIAKSFVCSFLAGRTSYDLCLCRRKSPDRRTGGERMAGKRPSDAEPSDDRFFIELIRLGQEKGEFRRDHPPELLHRVFVCALSGALVEWAARGGSEQEGLFQSMFRIVFLAAEGS